MSKCAEGGVQGLDGRIVDIVSSLTSYAAVLDHLEQGVCCFGGDHRLVLSNARYATMYGLHVADIRPGLTLQEITERRCARGGGPSMSFHDYLAWCASLTGRDEARVWMSRLQDGRTIRIQHQPTPDRGWIAVHEDVTDQMHAEGQLSETRASLSDLRIRQAQSEAKLARLVRHDVLTDLPNRTALGERLATTLATAAERREGFAVICLDLDHFKGVNEFFGNAVGDALLRDVARRFEVACADDFLARVSGDEFMVIATHGPQPRGAAALVDRLEAALAGERDIDGLRLRIGVSIGVAVYPVDGKDETGLLANATAALQRAKAEGRGTCRFFEEAINRRQRERIDLQRDLRQVLVDGELLLHYQPLARVTGEVFGFEALVRWRHPRHGLLQPGAFIELAEESGFISEIGTWVMREACREAASWPNGLRVSVNVSPLQFRHTNLAEVVRTALDESGLAPGRLEIEITESVLISNPVQVVAILRQLKDLGVKVSMDDFGTGYSSLSSLQSFPFDKIKIDRAFTSQLGINAQSTAIVRAVIGLGRNLNLPVLAEGVETERQRAVLIAEGCPELQGFLIGRPQPIEHYAELTGASS